MKEKVQLFILPFSGSKAMQFDQFSSELGDEIQTFTMEYAGRGKRAKEPFFTDYSLFMDDVYNFIMDRRNTSIPFALIGYSIGGFFAYDLLAKGYLSENPIHLFISGCENNKEPLPPISQMPEEEFWDRVIRLGGVDKILIENRRFLKLFSKIMRADFYIAEQHQYLQTDGLLSCPVTVLYSETDTPFENVKRWQDVSKQIVSYKEFRGNHFFLLENYVEVANYVRDKLGIESNIL